MAKEKFTKGHKVRVIKTDLDSLEIEHAKKVAGELGTKSLPHVEIHHDPETDKYLVSSSKRRDSKEHHPYTNTSMNQGEFTKHVIDLHRNHPKMQPFPKEARVTTKPNGHVDIHIAHPDY